MLENRLQYVIQAICWTWKFALACNAGCCRENLAWGLQANSIQALRQLSCRVQIVIDRLAVVGHLLLDQQLAFNIITECDCRDQAKLQQKILPPPSANPHCHENVIIMDVSSWLERKFHESRRCISACAVPGILPYRLQWPNWLSMVGISIQMMPTSWMLSSHSICRCTQRRISGVHCRQRIALPDIHRPVRCLPMWQIIGISENLWLGRWSILSRRIKTGNKSLKRYSIQGVMSWGRLMRLIPLSAYKTTIFMCGDVWFYLQNEGTERLFWIVLVFRGRRDILVTFCPSNCQ